MRGSLILHHIILTDHRVGKAELVKRGISYRALQERLESLGVSENYGGLTNKINRGTFSFSFFLQCMQAVGASAFTLDFEEALE